MRNTSNFTTAEAFLLWFKETHPKMFKNLVSAYKGNKGGEE